MAKRAASPYRPGTRSHDWRKVKALCLQDCVIVGWTPGKGGRAATLGSLLLAVYDGGRLRYAGNVGTGFTHAFLADLLARLAELWRSTSPCSRASRAPCGRAGPASSGRSWSARSST